MNIQKFFFSKEDLEIFMKNEKDWVYNRIYEAVEEAYVTGKNEAEIFEAKIEDDFSTINITSVPSEWLNSLTLCLEHFVKNEEYEKCNDIKLLIEDIGTHLDEL